MALEQRGSNFYYYGKERRGGRVCSIYYGSGETAVLMSRLDEARREEAGHKLEVARHELAKLERYDASIEATCRMIDSITEAALLAAGFHTHKRQWRRKRDDHSGGEGTRENDG